MREKILGKDRPVALVIGASSGMGAALSRCLVREGYAVALIARRQELLDALADELNSGHQGKVAEAFAHDVTKYDEIPTLFQEICEKMRGLDLLVYATGVMPTIDEDEYDFAKDRQVVEINLLGAMGWFNEVANRFQYLKHGTIVGISSVAGERGRRGNPAYAASKAAMTTFLESLRNRLSRYGVRVITIKPGPVRTPMTAHLEKQPLMIEVEEAAEQIMYAIKKNIETAYVPGVWRPVMSVIRNIPSALFRHLSI